jgi:hypothetical protein
MDRSGKYLPLTHHGDCPPSGLPPLGHHPLSGAYFPGYHHSNVSAAPPANNTAALHVFAISIG